MIGVDPWRGALALAYMGGIFCLSAVPASRISQLGISQTLADLAHVPLFAGLGSVILLALTGRTLPRVAAALGLASAFALSDEWHQTFVPGRVFSGADLGSDAIGAAIGVVAVLFWQMVRTRETQE